MKWNCLSKSEKWLSQYVRDYFNSILPIPKENLKNAYFKKINTINILFALIH